MKKKQNQFKKVNYCSSQSQKKIAENAWAGVPYSVTQKTVPKLDLSPFRIQVKHVQCVYNHHTLKDVQFSNHNGTANTRIQILQRCDI
jgi:hypothetical protein